MTTMIKPCLQSGTNEDDNALPPVDCLQPREAEGTNDMSPEEKGSEIKKLKNGEK